MGKTQATKKPYRTPNFEGVNAPIDIPGMDEVEERDSEVNGTRVDEPENRYAPAAWKKQRAEEFDVQTPSGQWCRMRKLLPKDVFQLGLMDVLDMLTPELMGGDGEEAAKEAEAKLVRDKGKRDRLFSTVDAVVMACVLEPHIVSEAECVDDTTVSIDDVLIGDKMFVFGVAFGNDIDALKSQYAESSLDLGAAFKGKGVRKTTK